MQLLQWYEEEKEEEADMKTRNVLQNNAQIVQMFIFGMTRMYCIWYVSYTSDGK